MFSGLRFECTTRFGAGFEIGNIPEGYVDWAYHRLMEDKCRLLFGLREVQHSIFFSKSIFITMSQPSVTTSIPGIQLACTAQKLHVLKSLSHFPLIDPTTDFLNALFSHPLGSGLEKPLLCPPYVEDRTRLWLSPHRLVRHAPSRPMARSNVWSTSAETVVSRLRISDDLKTVDGSSVTNWPTSSEIIEDTWLADEEFESSGRE
jgi:hypothetical protein